MATTPRGGADDRLPLLSVDAAHVAPSSLSSRAALAVATGGLVSLASAGTALLVMTSTSAVTPSTDTDAQPLLGGQPGSSEVVVPQAPTARDGVAVPPGGPARPAGPVILAGTSGDRPVRVVLPGPLESAPDVQGPVVPVFPPLSPPLSGPGTDGPVIPPVDVPEVPGAPGAPGAPEVPAVPVGGAGPVVTPHVPPVLDGDSDDDDDSDGDGEKAAEKAKQAAEKAADRARKAAEKQREKAEKRADREDDRDRRAGAAKAARTTSEAQRTDRVRTALRAEAARMDRERREDRFREALRRELAAPTRLGRGKGHSTDHSSGHGRLAV